MGLVDDVLAGSLRALARLATHVENDDDVGRAGLTRLYSHGGRAHIIGITGPPGAGKSTLINRLIAEFRRRQHRVAVIAIDPSSPLSGGAALGDRIRMLDWQTDTDVFIRSMASRGQLGGLAPATSGMVHLLDAAGYDVVIVETVGVGQEAIDVSSIVHTVVVVQVPASGDSVQLLKAGLLEFADVFVVNKADLAGAEELIRGLRSLVGFAIEAHPDWFPAVVRCSATSGEGATNVADVIRTHWEYLQSGQRLEARRRFIAKSEIAEYVNIAILRRLWDRQTQDERIGSLVHQVAERRMTPFYAANALLERWDEIDSAALHET